MIRRLYDWCVGAANKPTAKWTLGAVSFAESSFFPIPPDAMLVPMGIARPDKAFSYAFLCTWTSVAGGVLGYLIGALLYDSVGQLLIQLYGLSGKMEAFRESYAKWGAVIILLKGLTPIPYKLVTITSGFAGYNIFLFIVFSIICRAMRFYLVAFLLYRYGERARVILEERLELWALLFAVLVIGGIAAAIYFI
jgi:membrane protein YqaA with SNARE-associated domain